MKKMKNQTIQKKNTKKTKEKICFQKKKLNPKGRTPPFRHLTCCVSCLYPFAPHSSVRCWNQPDGTLKNPQLVIFEFIQKTGATGDGKSQPDKTLTNPQPVIFKFIQKRGATGNW